MNEAREVAWTEFVARTNPWRIVPWFFGAALYAGFGLAFWLDVPGASFAVVHIGVGLLGVVYVVRSLLGPRAQVRIGADGWAISDGRGGLIRVSWDDYRSARPQGRDSAQWILLFVSDERAREHLESLAGPRRWIAAFRYRTHATPFQFATCWLDHSREEILDANRAWREVVLRSPSSRE